jgi:murein DD-endopeptidase MepM/ murein hydrolase activator NlpD
MDPVTEEVAMFVRPFEGGPDLSGFFDHGSVRDQHQLTRNGTLAYGRRGHQGYDFTVRTGTPVFAMAGGRVVEAGDVGPIDCGGRKVEHSVLVRIVHDLAPNGERYATMFLHLSDVTVAPGELVAAGQLVGHSGNTGCSSGPHLHLAVFRARALAQDALVDPYGWRGPGADPHPERSVWLWKPGQAPPLRRHARRPPHEPAFGPARLQGTDLLDPIGGEWLDLVNPTAAPRSVGGLVLTNDAGDRLALPDRTIEPGRTLRVWTLRAEPGERGLSWGLDHEAWNDAGDCARLLDASGAVIGAVRFGPKRVVCPVTAPGEESQDAEEAELEETDALPLAIPVAPDAPAGPEP